MNARDSITRNRARWAGRIPPFAHGGIAPVPTLAILPAEKSPRPQGGESPERSRGETQDERAEEGQSR